MSTQATQDKTQDKAKPAAAKKIPLGEERQKAVAALHEELSSQAKEHHFVVGDVRRFGLEFDVYDPISNTVMTPARAHRRDVGVEGALKTAADVVADITSARRHLDILQGGPPVAPAKA